MHCSFRRFESILHKTCLNCFWLEDLKVSNPGKGRKGAKQQRKMAPPRASATRAQQPEPQYSTPKDTGEGGWGKEGGKMRREPAVEAPLSPNVKCPQKPSTKIRSVAKIDC